MIMDSIYSSKTLLDIVSIFKNLYQNSKVVLLYKNHSDIIDGIEYTSSKPKNLKSYKTNWEPNGNKSVLKITEIDDSDAVKIFKNYDIDLIYPVNTSNKKITILGLCNNSD